MRGPSRARSTASDDGGETWRELQSSARAALATDVELSTEAVDVARALDRSEPARGGHDPRRHRAGWADALDRRRRDVAGPPARRPARRPLARVASAERGRAYEAGGGGAAWSEDGGDTWRPADDGRDRHYTWSVAVDPDDPELWYVSASTGPFAAHGRGDPQAHIYRRRNGGWDALAGGLPDPLPSMPYALVATGERLFAGLASGELWESRDRGDTWQRCELLGERLARLLALAGVAD